MVQNFSLLEYGNCRDPCASADAIFYSCSSQYREKNPVLPIEKVPLPELARNTIMLQHLIIHFSLHQPSSGRLREVKYNEKFQTLYLQKLGLVHRAVMAANVLVGDNYVCKLSGMQFLQQLTSQSKSPQYMINIIVQITKVKSSKLP